MRQEGERVAGSFARDRDRDGRAAEVRVPGKSTLVEQLAAAGWEGEEADAEPDARTEVGDSHVVSPTAPVAQEGGATHAEGGLRRLQLKSAGRGETGGGGDANGAGATGGGGKSLPPSLRLKMERAFGADFSAVSVHEDGSAQELGAQAYARGEELHFAPGQYDPESAAGQELIGHELAHVVQQRQGRVSGPQGKGGVVGDASLEAEADDFGARAARGETVGAFGGGSVASGGVVQLKADKGKAAKAKQASGPSVFDRYLDVHQGAVRAAIAKWLLRTHWPHPTSVLPWHRGAERTFGELLVEGVTRRLATIENLMPLVFPRNPAAKFETLVPRSFALTDWSTAFGEAVAQLVERSATESLAKRMGPRYQAALAQMFRMPTAEDLIFGHPMDPLVAAAMTAPGLIDVIDVVAMKDLGPPKLGNVTVTWLGRKHPQLWNYVEATPASATTEEVAAALWGSPSQSVQAYTLTKFGRLFRMVPKYARELLAERYPGEVIGTSNIDASKAVRLLAQTRDERAARDKAPTREEKSASLAPTATKAGKRGEEGDAPVPSIDELMGIERAIGVQLQTIKSQIEPVGLAKELAPAFDARASRVLILADADEATRVEWLPVLQYQHTFLLSVAPRIARLVQDVRSSVAAGAGPSATKPQGAEQAKARLVQHLRAVAVSHDRDVSNALLSAIVKGEKEERRSQADDMQLQLRESIRGAIESTGRSVRGDLEAEESLQQIRERQYDVDGPSVYSEQQALIAAGEVALRARMESAKTALRQVREAADRVFPDPSWIRKMWPQAPKTIPELIAEVTARLEDVDRVWRQAIRSAPPVVPDDPNAPDDWADWEARAAGVKAAQEAFATIAGDQDLGSFLRDAIKEIKDQQLIHSLTSLAFALLITVVTGMGAAALGRMAASTLAGEASALAARGIAVAVDIGINTSINTLVQAAQAEGEQSVGWMALENGLMELFTRGMLRPLEKAQQAAMAEARQLAALPGLSDAERALVSMPDFTGIHLLADTVGTMATQWAAHHLVERVKDATVKKSPAEQIKGEVSEPFALTVLQQGAAIGLGKFFHGQLERWKQHRAQLEKTRIGQLPEAKALFEARAEFYAQAERLAKSLSPDPAEGYALQARDLELLKQERVLLGRATGDGEPVRGDDGPADTSPRVGPRLPHESLRAAEQVPDSGFTGVRPGATPLTAPQVHAAVEHAVTIVGFGQDHRFTYTPHDKSVWITEGPRQLRVTFVVGEPSSSPARHNWTSGAKEVTVTVSREARPEDVRRAIAHELVELHALLEVPERDRKGVLSPGSHSEDLAAHDIGRRAELQVLLHELAYQPQRRADIKHELTKLIEHLGFDLKTVTKDPRARKALGDANVDALDQLAPRLRRLYDVDEVKVTADKLRGRTAWVYELSVLLPNGEYQPLGSAEVLLDSNQRPLGGPSFYIDKRVVIDGEAIRLGVAESGSEMSLTDFVIRRTNKAFRERFGHPPSELRGSLGMENKALFQRAYLKHIDAGVDPDAAKVLAIREIPFGTSRARNGFDQFDVKLGSSTTSILYGEPSANQARARFRRCDRKDEKMSQLEDHHRKMIERTLGRSLLEEELREVPTLDALSDAQLAVINKLSRLQIIAYLNYLRAVVPHVTMAQATEFMTHIQRVMVPPRD